MAEASIDLRSLRRVLVVKPSSLGDIIHALPAIHDLKTHFPHLEIRWLANTEWTPILEGNPHLNGIIAFPRSAFRGVIGGWKAWRWLQHLHRDFRPDLVLDLQGLLRSGIISWFSRGTKRVGLSDAREGSSWFHHFQVPVDPTAHAVDRYREVPRVLGAPLASEPVFTLPKGTPIDRPLPDGFIALHPFSRGEGKSLTSDHVNAYCAQAPLPVVVLGRVDPLTRAQLRLPEHCLDLLNSTSIPQLITCLRRATGVISVDSGPMHLAAALQPARTLSIHTWSDPRKVGPYSSESWVLKGSTVAHRQDLSAERCAARAPLDPEVIQALITWTTQIAS